MIIIYLTTNGIFEWKVRNVTYESNLIIDYLPPLFLQIIQRELRKIPPPLGEKGQREKREKNDVA